MKRTLAEGWMAGGGGGESGGGEAVERTDRERSERQDRCARYERGGLYARLYVSAIRTTDN